MKWIIAAIVVTIVAITVILARSLDLHEADVLWDSLGWWQKYAVVALIVFLLKKQS